MLLSCMTCAAAAFAQLKPYNNAVIWRGFEHNWTYNHRCNRIGDFVQLANDSVIMVHTSATGTGNDSTHFSTHYTTVSTPDAVFLEGNDTVNITGDKDSLIITKDTVDILMPEWLRNKTDYLTLLNGFDLRSAGEEAQKVQVLYITVSDGEYFPELHKLRVIIKTGMVLNCTTAECKLCNHTVKYKLTAYYLVVGLNKHDAAATTQLFVSSYSWNKKNQLKEPPLKDYMQGSDYPEYKKALLGLKSFSVVMDRDHWLLQWNNKVEAYSYDEHSTRLQTGIDQLYKEWRPSMRKSTIAPFDAKFSVKQRGWEVMYIDAIMLQFKSASIKDGHASGQMYWPGKNKVPDIANGPDVWRSASHFE